MTKHLTDSRRDALCQWLTANGISPNDVPVDADLTIDKGPAGRFIRCEVFDRTPDGKLQTDDRIKGPATLFVNVPLKTEPPTWWQPYKKPTRDRLLAAVKEVRQLHQPTGVVAAAEAGVEPDCAVCGPNRWPCPTYNAVTDLEQTPAKEQPDA